MRAIHILITMIITCGASFGAKPEAREWNAPDGTLVKYRFHSPAKIEKGKTFPLVLFLLLFVWDLDLEFYYLSGMLC